MSASPLTVTHLYKAYPGSKEFAVNGISFNLKEGEILGLLGPNGSGKTTTIQMLLGTLSLSSGSIQYFGKDFLAHRSEVLQTISYASAYTSLPWLVTVSENLEVFGRLYNLSPRESRKRYEPLLERFGLVGKRDSQVSALSAGQITRLMLVKAFFTEPKIVLLDEPTASLDPDMAQGICEFILEEREKRKLSILFTSHKMEEATELCDRVIFLKEGKIIADGLPRELAKSVSQYRLKLSIVDGLKRVIAYVEEKKIPCKIEHRMMEVTLEESEIPIFLNEVVEKKIVYSSIKIEEPSLEDYFLQIARKKK